jgi:probable addiction module antidote protein
MPIETTRFDIQDYLRTPEDQIMYLRAALDERDPSFIPVALGDIAKARGVTEFAAEAGLSREVIYKTFRPGGNPTLETIAKAMKVLGFRLSIEAA